MALCGIIKRISAAVTVLVMIMSCAVTAAGGAGLPFRDVRPGAWYYDDVSEVYGRGLMLGESDTSFAPEKNMTRAELAAVIFRLTEFDTVQLDANVEFSDVAGNEWYAEYVLRCNQLKIVRGYSDGTFRPNASVTRAELAAMISRVCRRYGIEHLSEDAAEQYADIADIPEWVQRDAEYIRPMGLIRGDAHGRFMPESFADRAELAAIIARLVRIMEQPSVGELALRRLSDRTYADEFGLSVIVADGTSPEEAVYARICREIDYVCRISPISVGSDVKAAFDSLGHAGYVTVEQPVHLGWLGDEDGWYNVRVTLVRDRRESLYAQIPTDVTVRYCAETFDLSGVRSALVSELGESVTGLGLDISVLNADVLSRKFAELPRGGTVQLPLSAAFTCRSAAPDGTSLDFNTERSYTLQLSSSELPNDTTPDNIGVMSERDGVKLSELVRADEYLQKEGLGYHGGHDTRVVRNEYGTYMVFYDGMEYNEKYPEGSRYAEFAYWCRASIYKITPSGSQRIFSYRYPRTMCAAPNILAGDDGIFYITAIADDKERYLDSGLSDEGPWLAVYELDSKTDTVRACEERLDFEYHWNTTYTAGYGYSQPFLDEEHGKLYLVHTAGNPTGYIAYFTYDLESHAFVGECKTVVTQFASKYLNIYPDGNGGLVIVAQRDLSNKVLTDYYTELYGRPIQIGNGSEESYVWDAIYIYHIADPENPAAYTRQELVMPDYQGNMTSDGYRAKIQSISHYAGGCTYMDYDGRLHIIYCHSIGSRSTTGHIILDRELREVYRTSEFAPTPGDRTRYSVNMTQDASGKFYAFVSPIKGSAMSLEVWESDDGISFTHRTTFENVGNRYTGGAVAPNRMMIIGSGRNRSSRDGVVPFCFAEDGVYYYFSVKLPSE